MRSPTSRTRPRKPLVAQPPARRTKRTTQEMIADNKGPGLLVTTLRTLAGLAVAALVVAVMWFVAAAIEGDEPSPLAPWNRSSAPAVTPDPLRNQ